MTPVLTFDKPQLVSQTQQILASLPEYGQDEFFSAALRQFLVDSLSLETDPWADFIGEIRRLLGEQCRVLIRGLPFDDNNRLSVALASVLGTPQPHNKKVPALVREIKPRPLLHDRSQPFENLPHTDSPHWIEPNDLITLQCKTEDQVLDVYSRITPVWAFEQSLKSLNPALYRRLFDSEYPFILIPEQGDSGWQMQPVLQRVEEGGEVRTHLRFCYPDSVDTIKRYGLSQDFLVDLEEVLRVANEVSDNYRILFKQNDWLIFDNKRVFHSKTDTSKDTRRVLKKMKLMTRRDSLFD